VKVALPISASVYLRAHQLSLVTPTLLTQPTTENDEVGLNWAFLLKKFSKVKKKKKPKKIRIRVDLLIPVFYVGCHESPNCSIKKAGGPAVA